ncbi:hypothetical protein DYB25_000234 [Aphanomyces astaci]|uniref:Cyclic nucleotide-binding domain-containing protein n=1 Tax=Aphanomyces astaci TaxID=112090 RepID=A0A397E1N7_APHAT|nr:hypothetical protein DYB36_001934 [Aphanomyces astaci]RHY12138.1 hypothetical protein DYB25_000234 [Aphanomyces astaci]RHY39082.1 hypothetical protein DYB30_000906 [Aphanomyces astaci]RHY47073.1 hypothetical protein DYB34_001050 [Aphanomyces astaci]RHY74896.1 hypothetical protein DYB38_001785 [Aphanomyces astaci]
MDGAKHASVHVVPILEEPNEPINLDHIAHTLDQTELNPIFPQARQLPPYWLVERKDFQTFFPRFGTRALSEDEKLRMAAQKEPEKRNGIDIQLLSKWLLNVPSLKALNVMQAGEIAKRMRWASFAPNQLVFKKGDIGDACYIIVNGQNVYRYQSKRRKKLTKWLRTEVSIFRDFSDNKLRYFESVSIDLFLHPGNCVYMEGEAVGALYIVKSGTISLEKNVLFETKHRRPTGIKAWSVQSHKTHIQVPSYVVESAGCFGMEYFVKVRICLDIR